MDFFFFINSNKFLFENPELFMVSPSTHVTFGKAAVTIVLMFYNDKKKNTP